MHGPRTKCPLSGQDVPPPPPSPPLSTSAAFLAMGSWVRGLRTRLAEFNKALLRTLVQRMVYAHAAMLCFYWHQVGVQSTDLYTSLVPRPLSEKSRRGLVWSGPHGTKRCMAVLPDRPLHDFSKRGLGTRLPVHFNCLNQSCAIKSLQSCCDAYELTFTTSQHQATFGSNVSKVQHMKPFCLQCIRCAEQVRHSLA